MQIDFFLNGAIPFGSGKEFLKLFSRQSCYTDAKSRKGWCNVCPFATPEVFQASPKPFSVGAFDWHVIQGGLGCTLVKLEGMCATQKVGLAFPEGNSPGKMVL